MGVGIPTGGSVAISMTMTGVMTVAMPLIAEFPVHPGDRRSSSCPHPRRKDRGRKKIVAIPARLLLGSDLHLSTEHLGMFFLIAFLVALFSAAGGLTLGCSVGQTQIGSIFSMVLAPMIMFGCAYYPWKALESFPILQRLVLLNPLVDASEGLRDTLAPQYLHIAHRLLSPCWQ